jgi:hypothetical protein
MPVRFNDPIVPNPLASEKGGNGHEGRSEFTQLIISLERSNSSTAKVIPLPAFEIVLGEVKEWLSTGFSNTLL